MEEYPTNLEFLLMEHADTVIDVLRLARSALVNVPCVGSSYDQQHSDTHMRAYLEIGDLLARLDED